MKHNEKKSDEGGKWNKVTNKSGHNTAILSRMQKENARRSYVKSLMGTGLQNCDQMIERTTSPYGLNTQKRVDLLRTDVWRKGKKN